MRIAIVTHSLHGGGAEFVTRSWARALADRGHHVCVFLTDDEPRVVDLGDVDVRKLAGQGGAGHLRRTLRLRHELAAGRFDVSLGMQTYPSLMLLAASRGSTDRAVVSERNMTSILLRREGISQRIQLALAKRLYSRSAGAVAISHPVAADLISSFGLDPGRVFVVPNPAASSKPRRSAPLPASDVDVSLTLPFRFAHQKQPHVALDVASVLLQRGHRLEIAAFGDGPLLASFARAADERGIPLRNHGWTEDWTAHLNSSSVVLLPSYCEGFGNVLVEAACAGVASVASSVALGVADAIVPGVTGEFATTLDAPDLADAVERASGLEVHADGWLSRFSLSNSVETLENVLTRVAGAERSERRRHR